MMMMFGPSTSIPCYGWTSKKIISSSPSSIQLSSIQPSIPIHSFFLHSFSFLIYFLTHLIGHFWQCPLLTWFDLLNFQFDLTFYFSFVSVCVCVCWPVVSFKPTEIFFCLNLYFCINKKINAFLTDQYWRQGNGSLPMITSKKKMSFDVWKIVHNCPDNDALNALNAMQWNDISFVRYLIQNRCPFNLDYSLFIWFLFVFLFNSLLPPMIFPAIHSNYTS